MTLKRERKYPKCLESVGFKIIGEFTASNKKHHMECLKCGKVIFYEPRHKMTKLYKYGWQGCNECVERQRIDEGTYSPGGASINMTTYNIMINVVKMRPIDGPVSQNILSKYQCLECNEIYSLRGSNIMQRYKQNGSIGCIKCNKKRLKNIQNK